METTGMATTGLATTITGTSTLAERFWPASTASARLLRNIVLVIAGTALLTLSAKLKVPFWPVHMTMQTAVVLMIGAAYGWRLGTLTVLAYLAEGALGAPVFTGTPEKGLGLAYMAGPTGGYLAGFVAAAFITGWFADRGFDRRPLALTGVMLAAEIVLYALGLLWLGTLVGWDKTLQFGLYPFLPAEIVKLALAVAVIMAGGRIFRDLRGA